MSPPSAPDAAPPGDRRGGAACPLCGAPAAPAHRPFCGQGCRDRDLLAWLGDTYRLPGGSAEAGEEIDPDALDTGRAAPL